MRTSRFLDFDMKSLFRMEIDRFVSEFSLSDRFFNSTFLVTGATGLIGSTLIKCLQALSENIKIIAPVRNKKKAEEIFKDSHSIQFIEGNLKNIDYKELGVVDYIVHGAAPTSSKYFVNNPVETIDSIISITRNLLEYAIKIPLKGFLFLSSLEVYGQNLNSSKIIESVSGNVDILDIRSSYPLAKQLAENLCVAYWREYNVPTRIARLTQTTGPGVLKDDNRVIVQFVRCAVNSQDIVLHTTGESSRPYCYTFDAVEAILYILAKGENGRAYNVANESSYISAKDLAYLVKNELNPSIEVKFNLREDMGYAPTSYLNLSSKAAHSLGWIPKYSISDIISNLYQDLKEYEY